MVLHKVSATAGTFLLNIEVIMINLKSPREKVLAAVKVDGWELFYASKEFKNDREIVLAAVNSNGSALEYASQSLKEDKDIVMAAIKQNKSAISFVSPKLRTDRDINNISYKHTPAKLAAVTLINTKEDGYTKNSKDFIKKYGVVHFYDLFKNKRALA